MSDIEKTWIQQEIQRLYDSGVRNDCTLYYVRVLYTVLIVNANNDPASPLLRSVLYARHRATDDISLASAVIENMKLYATSTRTANANIATPVQPVLSQGEYYKRISSFIVALTDITDRPAVFDVAISGFITRVYSLLYFALMDIANIIVPYKHEIIKLVCTELGHTYNESMTPLSLAYTVVIASFKSVYYTMNVHTQMHLFTWAIRTSCTTAIETLLNMSNGKLMEYGYYIRSKEVYTTPMAVAIDSSNLTWGKVCEFLSNSKYKETSLARPDDRVGPVMSTRQFIQLFAPHLHKGG